MAKLESELARLRVAERYLMAEVQELRSRSAPASPRSRRNPASWADASVVVDATGGDGKRSNDAGEHAAEHLHGEGLFLSAPGR